MNQILGWIWNAKKALLLKFWLSEWQLNRVMSDRKRFEAFVYTKLDDALKILEERENIEVDFDLPEEFQNGKRAVLFRQLATPNFEIMRFLTIVSEFPKILKAVLFEYHHDKFTTQNDVKYFLGKMHFYNGIGKKGGAKVDTHKVIEFNGNDGKSLRDVVTTWGQSLVDFHRELFNAWNNDKHEVIFFDASEWFKGKGPKEYYEDFLKIFIKNGILFENFVLQSKKEEWFTREVFLPVFIKVWIKTGYKPLIVSLAPTDIEGDGFWHYYPNHHRLVVEEKINNTKS